MKKLWEILVPVMIDGIKVKKKQHREWDKQVSAIAGGLTLFKPKKGRWLYKTKIHKEKMIRVRIAATRAEINHIATITAQHYKQKAVMFYVISSEAVVMEF